ncbi:NADH-quinone oxidoreductase subunit K [Candidatus Bipolaricaulota bacterium]|nr:NADH-quinone oxidoreductase subunit K [Candidatus Bipolaricaulota bacterium]
MSTGVLASAISIIIVCIGVLGLILKRNLLLKLLSLNIVNTATILFFVLVVYSPGDRAPIDPSPGVQYADPLPQALVLTSIVINFGVLALSLLFTMVLVKRYHTLDLIKIEDFVRREFEEEKS